MASKLYVGGLSYSTTSETLREYFAQCGTVESAAVITDKFSGRFRLVVRGHMKVLAPGDWIEIPRGTVHNAAVMGDQPVVSLDAVKL